uniref:Uncharacterized protein n=1 Tax=Denticeps clupeoides TaxID=299321 RepID=A0AAY4DC81_9TELE
MRHKAFCHSRCKSSVTPPPTFSHSLNKTFRRSNEMRYRQRNVRFQRRKTVVQSVMSPDWYLPFPIVSRQQNIEPLNQTPTAKSRKSQNKTQEEDLESILQQCDLLHEGDHTGITEAFHLLQHYKKIYSKSPEFLWRLGRSYIDMYYITKDPEEKKSYAINGCNEAKIALMRKRLSAECHRQFAILTSLKIKNSVGPEKIETNYILKQHLDRFFIMDHEDPVCYYLLGCWCYDMSTLNSTENIYVSTVFPHYHKLTSVSHALYNFLKAERLSSGCSLSIKINIAKCYKELGNFAESELARSECVFPSVTRVPRRCRIDRSVFALVI